MSAPNRLAALKGLAEATYCRGTGELRRSYDHVGWGGADFQRI